MYNLLWNQCFSFFRRNLLGHLFKYFSQYFEGCKDPFPFLSFSFQPDIRKYYVNFSKQSHKITQVNN